MLKGLICAFRTKMFYPYSSMNMLEDFIFALLLKAIGREKENDKD